MTSLDAYLKQAGVKVGTSTKKSSLDEYLAQAKPTSKTPAVEKAPVPEPKKSTLGKVGGVIKDVAKEVASSAITIPARLPQAIAMASGASEEDINRVSSKLSGGLIAPVPRNGGDVMKDVGRVVETGSLFVPGSTAVKLAAGGAVSGLGTSMRQGNDILSKETAFNVGVGGAFGYGLGKVIPKIMPKFSNKVVEKVDDIVSVEPRTIEATFGGENKIPVTTYGKGEVKIPAPQSMKSGSVPEFMPVKTKGKIDTTNPVNYKTAEEFVKAHGTPVYRGARTPDLKETSGDLGTGVYFTKDNGLAKTYAKDTGIVHDYVIDQKAKIVDESKIPDGVNRKEWAIQNGYDGISYKQGSYADTAKFKDSENVLIYNKDVIKTRSQLTDIWKKAQKQPVVEITPTKPVEAPGVTQEKQKIFERTTKREQEIPITERQTNPEQRRIALSESWDDVEQVVFNAKEPLAGSNRSAYLAVLSEHAEELARAGDSSLAQKLVTLPAFRNIQRESGQALQSLGMIGRQSVIKTVNNLKTKLEELTKDERHKGKVAELALGYQGGVRAFQMMSKAYGLEIDDETADDIKTKWREANSNIVKYWYQLNDAAILTIREGKSQSVGSNETKVTFVLENNFLKCQLPSGRDITYPFPRLEKEDFTRGETVYAKDGLRYMGRSSISKKWIEIKTYGGKFAEQITQALSRDILRDALLALHEKKYTVAMHIHDEIVCEVPHNLNLLEEIKTIMCSSSPWAKGLPLGAEGWDGLRYGKE